MYKTIKGLYKKGRIIPMEPLEIEQDETEVIITFLKGERKGEEKVLSSADTLLYTIGDRAIEGRFTDASEKHNHYLYSQKAR